MEFPLRGRTIALLSLMGASLAASAPANAQTVDDQQKAVIEVIISTAHSLCYHVATASRTKAEGVKGDVKAQLTGLANAVYARNGYCFKTQKAISTFGKSCFPPYGELQGPEKNRVTEIRIWEQQKGC